MERVKKSHQFTKGIFANAYQAADSANWGLVIVFMDGCQAKLKEQTVKLAKSWNDKPGKLGELVGWKIMGLEANEQFLFTRNHQWTVVLKSSSNYEKY